MGPPKNGGARARGVVKTVEDYLDHVLPGGLSGL
jgi:hypothetical protein